MNSRRNFLKSACIAGAAASVLPAGEVLAAGPPRKSSRHWVWTNPDLKDTGSALSARYKSYYDSGVRGIFFEADSPLHFKAAKAAGLEAHRWMWTMNRGEKELLAVHPEWYAISRAGKSCADHPPYVDYYRWLCPSRPEVKEYLLSNVRSILDKDYVDGIHLDYVRFCDVVLPVNLWSNYHIEQTRELPEYDFCYCEQCRSRFKDWRGIDIDSIQYPEASLSWRLFRYQAITEIVNSIAAVARSYRKDITAAVFPTPEVARRNVRQDWTNWNLSGVCPMIYHGFYKEPVSWIGDAVAEGVNWLNGKFPLYAGLFIPDFKSPQEIQAGMEYAMKNGAAGISLFGEVTEDVLNVLRSSNKALRQRERQSG